jgi:hypothetical protein
MDGATLVTTIKAWWSAFCRTVIDAARSAQAMLARKDAAPAVAEARPRREPSQPAERPAHGESWLLKEPEWFAAVVILGFLGIIEALSWATAGWPPCLVLSDDQTPSAQSGQETCATFSEGVRQLLAFLWDRADHNAVTGLAALLVAIFSWRLWRSSERMWRITEVAAGSAKRSADALVVAEQAQLLAVVGVSNIAHVLSELGKHEQSAGGAAASPDGASPPPRERVYVQYALKNYGRTPAVLKEISHDLQRWTSLPEKLHYLPIPAMPKELAIVAGASSEPLQCTLAMPLTVEAATSIRTGDSFLWLYGRVLYEDAFGREREHRFLYRYRIGPGFQPYYYKDYNKST